LHASRLHLASTSPALFITCTSPALCLHLAMGETVARAELTPEDAG